MEQNNTKEKYKQIIAEIPHFLPICYIIMVFIGMIFNYFKFSFFEVNIFQYATVFDFLISPFEDPNIMWFMLLSSVIPIVCIATDIYWKNHFPISYAKWSTMGMGNKAWYETYRKAAYFLLCIIYIILFAFNYGLYTRAQTEKQPDITVHYSDNEIVSGKQIGKVGNTLFLLNDSEVMVIPMESFVKRVTMPLQE